MALAVALAGQAGRWARCDDNKGPWAGPLYTRDRDCRFNTGRLGLGAGTSGQPWRVVRFAGTWQCGCTGLTSPMLARSTVDAAPYKLRQTLKVARRRIR